MTPRTTSEPAITADHLTLSHGTEIAVDALTLSVDAGTSTSVIGPNGSGKSTVLRAVAGLMQPRSGRLDVPAYRQRGGVAFVMQATEVDPSLPLSVLEAVRMARYPRSGVVRRMGPDDRSAVHTALERMEVADLAHRQIHELSGGQRQRVLVAQGLAQEAPLLLLDEPFTGLDVVSRRLILDAITEERSARRTVVFSTHDLSDARVADCVLLLARRMVAFGTPDEVLREGPLAAAFGGRMLRLDDGTVVVDDPHHDHAHVHADSPRYGGS